MCVYVWHAQTYVNAGFGRGQRHSICNCSYKWLWAVLHRYWEPRLLFVFLQEQYVLIFERTAHALNYWAIAEAPTPRLYFLYFIFRQCLAYSQSTNTGVWTTQGRIWFCNTKFSRKTEKSEICCDWGTKERLHRVVMKLMDHFNVKHTQEKRDSLCHE